MNFRERAHHGQKAEMGPCAASSKVLTWTFWLRCINGETVEGERGCNEILRYEGKAGKAPMKCVDPPQWRLWSQVFLFRSAPGKAKAGARLPHQAFPVGLQSGNPAILGEKNRLRVPAFCLFNLFDSYPVLSQQQRDHVGLDFCLKQKTREPWSLALARVQCVHDWQGVGVGPFPPLVLIGPQSMC